MATYSVSFTMQVEASSPQEALRKSKEAVQGSGYTSVAYSVVSRTANFEMPLIGIYTH